MVDSTYLIEVYRPQQLKKLPNAQKNRQVSTLAAVIAAGGAGAFVPIAGGTMTGPLLVDQNVAGVKVRLAMVLPGSQQDAPTTFGVASTYLGIGGGEWNVGSYRLIGFGYISAPGDQYPAVIGYEETNKSGNTHGDLVFGIRPTTTNVAPSINLRIRSDGQIMAEDAAYVPSDPKSIPNKAYVDAEFAKAVPLTQKGAVGGVASLDGSGKIPNTQLPPLTHDTAQAATEAAMLALAVTAPAMCIRTDFSPPHLFFLSTDPATTLANWHDMGAFAGAAAAPTALVGTAAIPGVAATYMRSDAAPAINPAIAPAWTGMHTFGLVSAAATPSVKIASTNPQLDIDATNAAVDAKRWNWVANTTSFSLRTLNDLGTVGSSVWTMTRSGNSVSGQAWFIGGVAKLSLAANAMGSNSGSGPWTHTGAFAVTGDVNVAGTLGSAANTNAPSPTNSGITLGGSPTWAMASFYDQGNTANNRSADLLFITSSIKLRFANDARSAFLDVLTINGGQALGVTGITSTSGSGAWAHTGAMTVSGGVTSPAASATAALAGLVKQGAAVPNAAGVDVSKDEFDALLASLRTAGVLAAA
jgi:hypothetical protein